MLTLNTVDPKSIMQVGESESMECTTRCRSAWTRLVRGTEFEAKMKSHPREVRFHMYKHLDEMISEKYKESLKEINDIARENGTMGDRVVMGYRVVNKDSTVDTNAVLLNSAIMVIYDLNETLDYKKID